MNRSGKLISCLVMFIVYAGTVAQAGNIPAASELLDKYTQALDSISNFIDEYEDTCDANYVLHSGASFKGRRFERGQIRYDGKCFYQQEYSWGDFNSREMDLPEKDAYYRCHITNEEMFYSNSKWIARGPGKIAWTSRSKGRMVNDIRFTFNVSFIMGYINCEERLDTVLRQAEYITVRAKTEKIGDSECFVLQAETHSGHYTIWLDPNHGFHPAKVTHHAGEGRSVGSHQLKKGETGKAYVKDVRFEQIDGLWVPMEAKAGTFNKSTNGIFLKEDHHYRRTRFILNPDHQKLGSFADPLKKPANDPELTDGTKVRIDHESNEYIWKNGKLELAENKAKSK